MHGRLGFVTLTICSNVSLSISTISLRVVVRLHSFGPGHPIAVPLWYIDSDADADFY